MLDTILVYSHSAIYTLIGLSAAFFLYRLSIRNHDFWEKRGIPYVKPLPFLGCILDNIRRPLYEIETERYKKLGTIYGYYEANNPLLSVADPVLLRDILVKDFQYFTGRREFSIGDTILDNMVTTLRGEDWKRVRSIITPSFSTGKIKKMLSIFKDCSKTLVNNFKTLAEEEKSVDLKKFYGAFTMDVIASSAFSTKIDSHNDPENVFVKTATNVFNQKFGFTFLLFFIAPRLIEIFRINLFDKKITHFFRDITLQIIEERKKTGQVRNDFLQLLMDTAKEVSEEEKWDASEKDKDIMSNYAEHDAGHQLFKTTTAKNLSMDELVAQCVIFFLAGYDTTGTTLSFVTYFLALNPDVQDKLRADIDQVLAQNNGELTYEAVQSMKYLDNVISETLRILPTGVRLERMAETDYKLGDTGIILPKGTVVTVPIYCIHRDPKNFADPEKFDPDRFTPAERMNRDPYTYIPFGVGPRNCIGMRFALMEMKVCLTYIVANFIISKGPETKVPLEFDLGQQGLLQPKGVMVRLKARKDSPLKTTT